MEQIGLQLHLEPGSPPQQDNPSSPTRISENNSAFTKFLQQKVSESSAVAAAGLKISSLLETQLESDQTIMSNYHNKDHQKSRSFCIESLLKSEAKLPPAAVERFISPALTPPSSGASPPPNMQMAMHNSRGAVSPPSPGIGQLPSLPQFPFPPQLLPYLLPGHQQAGNGGVGGLPSSMTSPADYVHMEYLARQGVFLNSFPGFAGKT